MTKVGSIAQANDWGRNAATRILNANSDGAGPRAISVVSEVAQVSSASLSGQLTTGGVAQVLAAANENRQGFIIQNYSATPLYVNPEGTASDDGTSLRIDVGMGYISDFVSGSAISIFGTVTGQKFYAREW